MESVLRKSYKLNELLHILIDANFLFNFCFESTWKNIFMKGNKRFFSCKFVGERLRKFVLYVGFVARVSLDLSLNRSLVDV